MPTTPHDLFHRMAQQWLGEPSALTGEDFADDVVVEGPFAANGPHRFEGRQQFLDFANPQREAFPVRFDGCRTIKVHETTDPETIVVEYELSGTSTTSGRQASARFIAVLTARDGKVVLWREYQNTLAIMQALGS